MNEKVLIKSKLTSAVVFFWLSPLCIGIFVFMFFVVESIGSRYFWHYFWNEIVPIFGSMTILPGIILTLIFYFWTAKCSMTVTDKRVFGKAAFGKRVDIPLDSISAIATGMLKGITVASSSGKIKFFGFANRDDLHNEISKLLLNRQEKHATSIKQETTQSNADELKKYKELLDSGVISQAEFETKKKQLLGL